MRLGVFWDKRFPFSLLRSAPGDKVIVISCAVMDDAEAREWEPKKIRVDEKNRTRSVKACIPANGDLSNGDMLSL